MANIRVNSVLELYDLFIIDNLKKKHNFERFIYAPPERDTGFRRAIETYGDKFFPIIFVFRDEPPYPADYNYSPAKYLERYLFETGNNKYVNVLNLFIKYNINFYSKNMYDMNKFALEFYKFQKDRYVEYDFTSLGLDFKQKFEVIFDNLSSMNTISEMFEIGLFFRYTYSITLFVPVFDLSSSVEVESIYVTLYDQDNNKIEEVGR